MKSLSFRFLGLILISVMVPKLNLTPTGCLKRRIAVFLSLIFAVNLHAYGQVNDGVMAIQRNDYASAMRLFRAAADQGDARAQAYVGSMYDQGLGIPQDLTEAAKWYRRAAELGYADAQANLAAMYAGGTGVNQSLEEYIKWNRLAAAQGHARALNSLGLVYQTGIISPIDPVVASALFDISATKDPSEANFAKPNLVQLSATLSAEQKDAAKKLAGELKIDGMLLEALDRYANNSNLKYVRSIREVSENFSGAKIKLPIPEGYCFVDRKSSYGLLAYKLQEDGNVGLNKVGVIFVSCKELENLYMGLLSTATIHGISNFPLTSGKEILLPFTTVRSQFIRELSRTIAGTSINQIESIAQEAVTKLKNSSQSVHPLPVGKPNIGLLEVTDEAVYIGIGQILSDGSGIRRINGVQAMTVISNVVVSTTIYSQEIVDEPFPKLLSQSQMNVVQLIKAN